MGLFPPQKTSSLMTWQPKELTKHLLSCVKQCMHDSNEKNHEGNDDILMREDELLLIHLARLGFDPIRRLHEALRPVKLSIKHPEQLLQQH